MRHGKNLVLWLGEQGRERKKCARVLIVSVQKGGDPGREERTLELTPDTTILQMGERENV